MSSLNNRPGKRAKRGRPEPTEETIARLDEAIGRASAEDGPASDQASGGDPDSGSGNSRPLPYPLSANRGERERQAAIGTIRRFRQDDTLAVRFLAVALNPYASDGRTMETYEDDQGYEYWIAPSDNRLIQAAPSANQFAATRQVRPDDRLAVAELRQLAYSLISDNLPSFARLRECLHPLEDNRDRQLYFFRFDDFRQPVPESELPPFVQVALRADGRLVSFTNTIPAEPAD